jgi:hypothetical protein
MKKFEDDDDITLGNEYLLSAKKNLEISRSKPKSIPLSVAHSTNSIALPLALPLVGPRVKTEDLKRLLSVREEEEKENQEVAEADSIVQEEEEDEIVPTINEQSAVEIKALIQEMKESFQSFQNHFTTELAEIKEIIKQTAKVEEKIESQGPISQATRAGLRAPKKEPKKASRQSQFEFDYYEANDST